MQNNPLNGQPPQGEEFSWYIVWGARGLGVIGGVLSMLLGIWTMVTISATCMISGLIEMLVVACLPTIALQVQCCCVYSLNAFVHTLIATGFIVVALEAPFCCMWLDFIERIAQFSENRPKWMKAVLYCLFGIIPLFFCFELSTFLGSGCVFFAGCVYGFLSLGRKAPRHVMMARANGSGGNIAAPVKSAPAPRQEMMARAGGLQPSESQQHIGQPADAQTWDSRVDSKAPYP